MIYLTDEQEWLTVSRATFVYSRTSQYLISLIKSGLVEGYRDGRPWMINKASLDEYLKQLAAAVDTRTQLQRDLDERRVVSRSGVKND